MRILRTLVWLPTGDFKYIAFVDKGGISVRNCLESNPGNKQHAIDMFGPVFYFMKQELLDGEGGSVPFGEDEVNLGDWKW